MPTIKIPSERLIDILRDSQKTVLAFLTTLAPKANSIEAIPAFLVGLLGAIIVVLVLRCISGEEEKVRKARLKREVKIFKEREDIFEEIQKKISEFEPTCAIWRVIIDKVSVKVMQDVFVRGLARYKEVPFPITVMGVIHSAILDQSETMESYRPQVIYMLSHEYPDEYLSEVTSLLNQANIKVINVDSFNSEDFPVDTENTPLCVDEKTTVNNCNHCLKPALKVHWCKSCGSVSYCSADCASKDPDHNLVCGSIKSEERKAVKSFEDFPLNPTGTRKLLSDKDVHRRLIEKKAHGKALLMRACNCYKSIRSLELHSMLTLYLCIYGYTSLARSASGGLISKAWELCTVSPGSKPSSLDSWRKLYSALRLPESDLGSLIFYFPMSLWYIITRVITRNGLNIDQRNKRVLCVHVVNAEEEVSYTFLIRCIILLMPPLDISVILYTNEVAPRSWLPWIRSGFLTQSNEFRNINFAINNSSYSMKSYLADENNCPSDCLLHKIPDIIIICVKKNTLDCNLNEVIQAALKDKKWIFFVGDDFIEPELALEKSLGNEPKEGYEIIKTCLNPFRRPGLESNPVYTSLHTWKWGYISGLKLKN